MFYMIFSDVGELYLIYRDQVYLLSARDLSRHAAGPFSSLEEALKQNPYWARVIV